METNSLCIVSGNAYERGRQRGGLLKAKIAAKIDRTLGHLMSQCPEALIRSTAEAFVKTIGSDYPKILEGLRGIADGAGIEFERFYTAALGRPAATFLNPISAGSSRPSEECSCFARPQSGDRSGILLAKNADLASVGDPIASDLTALRVEPNDGYRFLCYTGFPEWPGGTEGINEHGLAMVGSGVSTSDVPSDWTDETRVGVPLHILQSEILRTCRTIDEALVHIRRSPRGFLGRDLLLADRTGAWAKCEVSFDHLEVERGGGCPYLIGTSHYQSERMAPLSPTRSQYPSSYLRMERLAAMLSDASGDLELEDVRSILADHRHGPSNESICRHSDVSNTLGSVCFEDAPPQMHVLFGRPCETRPVTFDMDSTGEAV